MENTEDRKEIAKIQVVCWKVLPKKAGSCPLKEDKIKHGKRRPEWITGPETECFSWVFISGLEVFRAWLIIQWQKERGELFFSKDSWKVYNIYWLPKVLGYSSAFDSLILSLRKQHVAPRWNSDCCWILIKNKAKNIVLGFMDCMIEKIFRAWIFILLFYHLLHLPRYRQLF